MLGNILALRSVSRQTPDIVGLRLRPWLAPFVLALALRISNCLQLTHAIWSRASRHWPLVALAATAYEGSLACEKDPIMFDYEAGMAAWNAYGRTSWCQRRRTPKRASERPGTAA
jgi:hypothetical protein